MATQVEAALEAILAPLKAQRDRLNGELAQVELLARGLKEELKTVERVLRAADPNHKPPGPKGPKPPGGKTISDESLGAVWAVLEADPDRYGAKGEGFTATSLWRDHAATLGMSAQTVGVALAVFRDQDKIRLVKRGTGGSRIYKTVG